MKNQNGLTLIELLATIAIFATVSTLIFGVLLNSQNNYETLSTKNSLSQEANLAITLLKSYHREGQEFSIEYDDTTKKAFIVKGTDVVPLVSDPYSVSIKAGFGQYQDFTSPFIVNDFKQPLFIWLQLYEQSGKSYEIDTTIYSYYGE